MTRILLAAIVSLSLTSPVFAERAQGAQGAQGAATQAPATARVITTTAVLERPRGDSLVVGSVAAGTVLEVLERFDDWIRVSAPSGAAAPRWQRGWIHSRFVELTGQVPRVGGSIPAGGPPPGLAPRAAAAARPRLPARKMLLRGVGHVGATVFTARDSFEPIFGQRFGGVYGAGVQAGLTTKSFLEVSFTRFKKTGNQVLISGSQYFVLDVPHEVTIEPLEFTVGYRERASVRSTIYLGGGVGFHRFTEAAATFDEPESVRHVGYHFLGGLEYGMGRWLSLAGEVQWTAVPGGLGDAGVSAVVEEDDLGGVSFRVKIIVGR